MKPSLKKFIPAICWLCISTVLLTIPGSALPKESWLDNLHLDKIVHAGLFSMLVFLSFLPIAKVGHPQGKLKVVLLKIAAVALIYGVLMEFVQKFWIPKRSFDVFDILADGIGSFLPFMFFKQIMKLGKK